MCECVVCVAFGGVGQGREEGGLCTAFLEPCHVGESAFEN